MQDVKLFVNDVSLLMSHRRPALYSLGASSTWVQIAGQTTGSVIKAGRIPRFFR